MKRRVWPQDLKNSYLFWLWGAGFSLQNLCVEFKKITLLSQTFSLDFLYLRFTNEATLMTTRPKNHHIFWLWGAGFSLQNLCVEFKKITLLSQEFSLDFLYPLLMNKTHRCLKHKRYKKIITWFWLWGAGFSLQNLCVELGKINVIKPSI